MGRSYRRLRSAGQDAPAYSLYLAEALILGVELLLGTSGIADDAGDLDEDAARAAWAAHREKVLAYAAESRPGETVWAMCFDELENLK